jgi:hypothetical protein
VKKAISWLLGILVVLVVLAGLLGERENTSPKDNAATAGEAQAEEVPDAPTPEPTPEPLNVNVTGPNQTTSDQITLKGRLAVTGAKVRVNGHAAKVKGRRWTYTATITKNGDNRYRVVATKAGHPKDKTTAVVTRKLSAAEKAAAREAEKQAFITSATTIPYNQLEKNPKRYKGTEVVYRGQIFQIQEDLGTTWMLLSVTDEGYGFWDDNIWVDYNGTIQGAEDDIITVYGTIAGEQSYETQIGGETYVPKLRARYIVE